MKREDLLKSAGELTQPPVKSADEYSAAREDMAAEMNSVMAKRSDIDSLIGAGNLDMMQDNHRNHARFIESLLFSYKAEVFVDTVLWVFRAYRNHGFHLTYWPAQLDLWVEVMKKHITPESFEYIYPFYRWMIINQPVFVKLSDELTDSVSTPSHGG